MKTLRACMLYCLLLLTLSHSAFAVSEVIDKATWMAGVLQNVLPLLCKDGSYFRECFQTTSAACLEAMTAANRSCFEQFAARIPDQLRQPEEGQLWGRQVGSCTGQTFEEQMQTRRLNTQRCNTPSVWK